MVDGVVDTTRGIADGSDGKVVGIRGQAEARVGVTPLAGVMVLV